MMLYTDEDLDMVNILHVYRCWQDACNGDTDKELAIIVNIFIYVCWRGVHDIRYRWRTWQHGQHLMCMFIYICFQDIHNIRHRWKSMASWWTSACVQVLARPTQCWEQTRILASWSRLSMTCSWRWRGAVKIWPIKSPCPTSRYVEDVSLAGGDVEGFRWNNNNHEYVERLTCPGPKRLHIL